MAQDTVEVYRTKDDKWDWRRKAANGVVESTSARQGYENKSFAVEQAFDNNGGDFRVLVEGDGEVTRPGA